MAAPPVLRVADVHKRYGETPVLTGVSFEVGAGRALGLLGPNGAGKTSLIRMCLDLTRPDSGRIEVLGGAPSPELKRRIGYLPEERGLYPKQRVEAVLSYLVSLSGVPPPEARRRAAAWLERVGLGDWAGRRVRELSKGMQQKVQLGAAILHEPDLVILDEPFTGLDPVNRRLVAEVVRELQERGAAVVISSHLIDQVQQLCEEVVLIRLGRILLSGAVADVRASARASAVELEASGAWAEDAAVRALVSRVEADPSSARHHLHLREGASVDALLQALLAAGARIDHFSRALPSLEDVFVQVVVADGLESDAEARAELAAEPEAAR